MSRLISKAEGFEVAYEAYQNINFNAFDFFTIKQSMIDYIKLYFPENFNDFIESSEFIALIELFAYLGEILAYRYDLNTHENIIDFAERKQSVLRLAKFISYKASRNVPARGLVRLDTVTTSETIFDSKGVNLSNRTIKWNDTSNVDWKDQFFIVMNRILEQDFGTVSPNERVQVNDILFELYPLINQTVARNAIPYQTAITNVNYDMELVSSKLTEFGPQEARPQNNGAFNIVYGSDGLGDGSSTTGFFLYTKQGSLSKSTTTFDGIIPNQTFDIGVDNINETDVWINKIDANTGDTVDDGSSTTGRSGEWNEVDLANAQNIIFNTNPNRGKYEIETLEDDNVRLVFGDGEFSDIPSGTFDIWYRTSVDAEIFIPKNGVVNKPGAFTYLDRNSRTQTFNFTFSLISSLQNNSPSEDIEQIRRIAPSVYYTQDRMVNGRDYNSFPLQDPSILKLRTINRTFAGESNFEQINDSSSTYQDVKMFGDDLSVYYRNTEALITVPGTVTSDTLLQNYVEPLLSTVDFFIKHIVDYPTIDYRREFSSLESQDILDAFESIIFPWPVGLTYVETANPELRQWVPVLNATDSTPWVLLVERAADGTSYTITYRGKHLIAESPTTRFYNENDAQQVLTFDSLNTNGDEVIILQANPSNDPTKLLTENLHLNIIDIERIDQGLPNAGLPNLNQVTVVTQDQNNDTIPDDITLPTVVDTTLNYPLIEDFNITTQTITLPDSYVTGVGDISVVGNNGDVLWHENGITLDSFNDITNEVILNGNHLSIISVGDLFNIILATNIQHNGQYRVNNVTFSSGQTHIFIETDLSIADSDGTNPLIKTNIDAPTGFSAGIVVITGRITNEIIIVNNGGPPSTDVTVIMRGYVYFQRDTVIDPFDIVDNTTEMLSLWYNDSDQILRKREHGRYGLNFLWLHRTDQFNLVDPSPTNINDMFVITRSYYAEYARWLANEIVDEPAAPTPFELRNTYAELLDNKMISDTVIMHPGSFKILMGSKANPELRAKIKVVRSTNKILTDNQLKIRIVNIVRDFFDVSLWEFGETFFYTELDTKIQSTLPSEISSTVLVPQFAQHSFGDLYQVFVKEDEIMQIDISVEDIEIVDALNAINIRQ